MGVAVWRSVAVGRTSQRLVRDLRTKACKLYQSEMLEDGKGYLLGGVGIFAVKEQDVEADRKGQRGHHA